VAPKRGAQGWTSSTQGPDKPALAEVVCLFAAGARRSLVHSVRTSRPLAKVVCSSSPPALVASQVDRAPVMGCPVHFPSGSERPQFIIQPRPRGLLISRLSAKIIVASQFGRVLTFRPKTKLGKYQIPIDKVGCPKHPADL
jgi:hypothetical protein